MLQATRLPSVVFPCRRHLLPNIGDACLVKRLVGPEPRINRAVDGGRARRVHTIHLDEPAHHMLARSEVHRAIDDQRDEAGAAV